MHQKKSTHGSVYEIRLAGTLDRAATDWFGEVTIRAQAEDETLLTGWFADQSALRGFLNQLWDLNFTVLSVEQIEMESRTAAKP